MTATVRSAPAGIAARVPAGLAVLGLLLLNLIVLTDRLAPLRAVIGLPVAAVLPGALALRALRITGRTGWNWLLPAVTLSLAGLLAIGLTLSLLPGAALNPAGALLSLDLLIAVLAVAAALVALRWPATRPVRRLRWSGGPGTGTAIAAAGLGAAAVALTVVGAGRLNAGGSGALTAAGLATAAAALTAAVVAGRRHHVTAAATGVYLVALAVLLATSLRGIGVTGHDIKIEYRVLLDTLDGGSWHPGGLFVGYNSCLSITVLPAFLARLLGLAAIDVYRVCFQVLFAVVPVGVYLLARRRVPGAAAVGAAGLFIAFPAFINDMPMLNRQEIALIFFVVLLGALFDVHSPRWQRATLFGIAAAGMTVSHYTSTYITAAVLLIGWALRSLRRRSVPFLRAGVAVPPPRRVLGLGLPAVTVTLLALTWAVVSGGAVTFGQGLYQAAAAVADRASVSADSTRYSLIGAAKPLTDAEALAGYVAVLRQGESVPPGAPPPPECAPRLPADTLSPTGAGTALSGAGVPPQRLNDAARGAAVLLFEGGGVVGCALLWWHRRREGAEALAHLAGGSLVLLAVAVVAPQLSDSYGLLRLYQQFLVLLAPLVMLSIAVPVAWVTARAVRAGRAHRVTAGVTGAVAVGCLLTTSGLVPHLIGGYVPQLSLSNAGPYFRAYYADRGDLAEAAWIGRHLAPRAYVVTDSRDTANLRSLTRLYPQEGLVPGAVPGDAYVALTTVPGDADEAVAVAIVGERVLRYAFPVACVAAGRPLVHGTTRHRLYGPVGQR